MTDITQPHRYPFASLADAMGVSENRACDLLGLAGSTAKDYRTRGVTERVGDRLACKAGLHPYVVWPLMADHAVAAQLRSCAAPGCDETFLINDNGPGGRNRRWCSHNCRAREAMRRFRSTERGREANRRYAHTYRNAVA